MTTRKDYRAIAAIIARQRNSEDDQDLYRLCRELADYFADDNAAFDRAKFLDACDERVPS